MLSTLSNPWDLDPEYLEATFPVKRCSVLLKHKSSSEKVKCPAVILVGPQ